MYRTLLIVLCVTQVVPLPAFNSTQVWITYNYPSLEAISHEPMTFSVRSTKEEIIEFLTQTPFMCVLCA